MSQIRTTTFRLVGQHQPPGADHVDIARENASASRIHIELDDPRWTLATMAYAKLKEGPITPETRETLIKKATRLGLRPFDASLIIAIAQDQSRHGRSLEHAESTLRLVRPPHLDDPEHHALRRWSLAIVCAALLSTALFML